MIELTKEESKKYYQGFLDFPHFHRFIDFIITDHSPVCYVDKTNESDFAIMHFPPAYFLKGLPSLANCQKLKSLISGRAYIIPESDDWHQSMIETFEDRITIHKRTLFSSKSLSKTHLESLIFALPDDLKIVPISQEHLKEDSIVYQDVISRFYTVRSFSDYGAGFVLVKKNQVLGFALANHPFDTDELELYFRVGFDSDPKYRKKGYGTLLCVYFLLWCLDHSITPVWDSAHEVSANIARKLGFTELENWNMYELK